MSWRDPSQEEKSQVDPLDYFTDREEAIQTFERHLNAAEEALLPVLVFYGVGGIGKTTLLQKLCANMDNAEPRVPHAWFNVREARDKLQPDREILLRLRYDLEGNFRVKFPHFDLCLAVMLAREKEDPLPLIRVNPLFSEWFDFATDVLGVPVATLGESVRRMAMKFHKIEEWVRRVGKTEEVIELRQVAMRMGFEEKLRDELIRCFVQDLQESLPARAGKLCRGVLILDTYEELWAVRERDTSVQSQGQDDWVRKLVFLQGRFDGCGVLNLLRENTPNKFGTPIFAPVKPTLKEH